MAKKVVDRRIQRTRQLLQNSLSELILEKGYEKVTVQDIIDRANVGRSTFYAHFQDKEELLLSGFEPIRAQFEDFVTGRSFDAETPWALSLAMFQQVQNRQGGYLTLTHVQKLLYGYLLEHLKPNVSKRNTSISAELLAHYVSSSFIALVTWWVDNKFPCSPEQMNSYFRQLVEPGVSKLMHMG